MPIRFNNVIRKPARWRLRRLRRGQASDGHHAEVCPEACSTRACGGEKSVVGKLVVDSEHHWWLCHICEKSVVVVIISTQLSVKGAEARGDGIGSRSGFMRPVVSPLPTLTLNPRLPDRTPPHSLTDRKGIAILLPWMILGFFLVVLNLIYKCRGGV